MQLIGEKRFVIEAHVPTGTFKNKSVLNEHTGEIELHPDGEPEYQWMWFAGVGAMPGTGIPAGHLRPPIPPVWGNIWTPYPDQAVKYKDFDEATAVNDIVLTSSAGGIVVQWELSHHREGLQVIVPVFSTIVGGKSNAGVDEKGRL